MHGSKTCDDAVNMWTLSRSNAGWKTACSLKNCGGQARYKCIHHKNLEDPGTCHQALITLKFQEKKPLLTYYNDLTLPSSLYSSVYLLIHLKSQFCLLKVMMSSHLRTRVSETLWQRCVCYPLPSFHWTCVQMSLTMGSTISHMVLIPHFPARVLRTESLLAIQTITPPPSPCHTM